MSDEEEEVQSEEEEEEEQSDDEEQKKKESEAALALKKRREQQQVDTKGLDDNAKELLEINRKEREQMEDEINELRRRNERRKKEREVEEKRLAAERAAEDERRKAAEDSKRRQKIEDEEKRKREQAKKKAEFEKWKNPPKPNFVISKRSGSAGDEDEEESGSTIEGGRGRKSKEQLEAEKRAILKQRVKPLEVDGLDSGKLTEKAKELHQLIYRLEGEKYDLEKRFKTQQIDMMELAERARQANKVGKGGLKRVQPGPDDNVDKIQERFAGAPAKVEMYSKYERQKDKRSYEERLQLFTGPQYLYPPERIRPKKIIRWNEEGMPIYGDADGPVDNAGGPAEVPATEE
jgi:troponin T